MYPKQDVGVEGQGMSHRRDDLGRLEDLLGKVGLEVAKLLPRGKRWDDVLPWNDILSGGERQRLALARVLYHSPQYVCLDEATSAVSKDIEAKLFDLCREQNITLISVSHRPYLRRFHSQVLTLKGDGHGAWELKRLGR